MISMLAQSAPTLGDTSPHDPMTVARQAPLSMGFSRQEYQSGVPFPSPGDLPNPGWNPHLLRLLHLQADSFSSDTTWKAQWPVRGCYSLSACVTWPNVYAVVLTPKVLISGGGAFGRWSGHEGGALIIGMRALQQRTQRAHLLFSTKWGHSDGG